MSDVAAPGVPQSAPLYRELERDMRAILARGEWKPGEAIPAERRLAERYGVSIGTVRKAIDALVDANLLIRQQGRGTFVPTHNRERLLFYFFHIAPEGGTKEVPVVRTVAFARGKADRVEAEKLGVDAADPVIRVRNVLSLAGEPIIVDDLAISASRFSGLSEKQFRERPSTIYSLYQDAFGVTVARASERLRATAADTEAAALLHVPRGAPLLVIRRVAIGLGGEPVEWRVSRVNTAHHEYYADIGGAT
ncbi:MAG: GntR family transcriptional regulator [Betaproteobacteria bacterium]